MWYRIPMIVYVLLGSALAADLAYGQPQKVLTVARAAPFVSLDPQKQWDGVSSPLVELVYSRLVAYSYLDRPMRLTTDLLERMPEVSTDGRIYRFTLRRGVRFHDDPCFPGGKGRELTANDVLFTIQRFADANVNTKSWETFDLKIVGLREYREATAKHPAVATRPEISGFKQTSSHDFTLTLTTRNPRLLAAFSTAVLSIVPEEAVRTYGDDLAVKPVGTGPFTLERADRKGVLRFSKYPRYHRQYPSTGEPTDVAASHLKSAGVQLPLVDQIDMPLIEEAQPALFRFLNGELDIQALDRASMNRMVHRAPDGRLMLKPEFSRKYQFQMTSALEVAYISLNLRDPLFATNKTLRQALAHLVDAQQIVDVVRGGRGWVARGVVADGVFADAAQTGAVARAFDLHRAKQLLAQAGYPDGKGLPSMTVSFAYANELVRSLFDLLKLRFAAAGVALKPNYLDFPTFVKDGDAGKLQVAWESWSADAVFPEYFFLFLHSRKLGGGWNHSAFQHAEFDGLLERAGDLEDGPAKLQLIVRMNEILHEEVPIIPVVQLANSHASQSWIRNFKFSPLVSSLPFVDVDVALKRAAR